MEQPIYVLKTNATVKIPVSGSKIYSIIRIVVWVIVGLLFLSSVVFQTNMLNEMSLSVKVILFSLLVVSLIGPKKNPTPNPLEIWFYKDYLVVYKERMYYSGNTWRREFFKFQYEGIEEINYNHTTRRLNIYGDVDATFFEYNKDGTLPQYPNYKKFTKGGIAYFYVFGNDEFEIMKTLENFTGKQTLQLNQREVKTNE